MEDINTMSNFAAQLKTEISRIARKESRTELVALKQAVSQSRTELATLKRRVAALETVVARLEKAPQESVPSSENSQQQSLRFRVDGFISLRKRLNLSAAEFAKLVGVSSQTIYHWESGKSRPQKRQLKAIAEIRKLGKKQVVEMLASS